MKRYYIAVAVLGIGVAVNAARASDLSRYSSRATPIGQPQEVSVAVLPGGQSATGGSAIAPATVNVSDYSSRAALIGHGREVTVAVLPGTSPAVAASTEGHAVAVESYSSRNALIGK